ncbi:MAG: hypothetical protein LBQ68_05215, partial [Clostridiales bacterium]|nr:hypothetical protein [Clostridiales bacterium]
MPVDIETLFNKDAFQKLEPEKREIFRRYAEQMEDTKAGNITTLLKFSKELSKGKALKPEEKSAIIQAIGESLPR